MLLSISLTNTKTIVNAVNSNTCSLFAAYGAHFSQSTPFTVEAAQALTEYIDDGLKSEFSALSPDVIGKGKDKAQRKTHSRRKHLWKNSTKTYVL